MIMLSVCELISQATFATRNFQLEEKRSRTIVESKSQPDGSSQRLCQPKSQTALSAFTNVCAPNEPNTNHGNPPRQRIAIKMPTNAAMLAIIVQRFADALSWWAASKRYTT